MSAVAPPSGEPVEATLRRSFTFKQRADVLAAFDYCCATCGRNLLGVLFEVDHRICIELGGGHHPDNWQPLCVEPCHRQKTARDRKAIAKAARIRRTLAGETKPGQKLRSRGFARDPLSWRNT